MLRKLLLVLFLCSVCFGTIENLNTKTEMLVCNGSQTVFTFTLPYSATSEIVVKLRTISTGAEGLQIETANYSVSPSSSDTGGTVTFVTAPADTYTLIIYRQTPLTQSADLTASLIVPLSTLETGYDKLTKQAQEHKEQLDRSVKGLITDSNATYSLPSSIVRANKYLAFNNNGSVIASAGPTGDSNTPVSAFMGALFSTADASAFLSSIGVSPFMATVLDDVNAYNAITTLGLYPISPFMATVLDDVNAYNARVTLEIGFGSTGLENLVDNGNFETWSAGTTSAPATNNNTQPDWLIVGSGATIARESTIKKIGSYSAKLTRNGTDCYFYQYLHSRNISYLIGRKLTFGCWVYTADANVARVLVGDTVGSSYSSYHTGDSTWQWLTVTRTIAAASTSALAYCAVTDSNASAYFDGAMMVEGEDSYCWCPSEQDRSDIALARSRSSFNLPKIAVLKRDTTEIHAAEVILVNIAPTEGEANTPSYTLDASRNAILFALPAGDLGYLYLGDNFLKSKVSCWYEAGILQDANKVDIFNRGCSNDSNYLEAVISPHIYNLILEKVYNDGSPHDVVLTAEPGPFENALPPMEYEAFFDLDANSISARKEHNCVDCEGQLTSAIGTFKNSVGAITQLGAVLIGFQNESATTKTCIIYLPIIVTSN